jgi:hypothetical protein
MFRSPRYCWSADAPVMPVEPEGSAFSGETCLAHEEFPFAIMHTPSAHMAAQGASDKIGGAAPTATSQFQPRATPPPTRAMARMTIARGLRIHVRGKSGKYDDIIEEMPDQVVPNRAPLGRSSALGATSRARGCPDLTCSSTATRAFRDRPRL